MLFSYIMASWWVIAEAILLIACEWGWRYTQGERSRRLSSVTHAVIVLAATSIALMFMRYHWPDFVGEDERARLIWRRSVWNAVCVLWVGFEAAILVYLSRIISFLERAAAESRTCHALPITVIALICLYLAWHLPLWSAAIDPAFLDPERLTRLYQVFVRCCGLFWVGIEIAIALRLISAWRLVAQRLE